MTDVGDIVPNSNLRLRLLAVLGDADPALAPAYDLPILAWYLQAGRHAEPIAIPNLRGVPYAVLDRDTGRAEIPGGRDFASADEALEHLRQIVSHPPQNRVVLRSGSGDDGLGNLD
jgi:hypothetical protein